MSTSQPLRIREYVHPTEQAHDVGTDGKPIAPRRACDRCRRSKLGCKLTNGKLPCQRCLKSSADCVTVPRQKRRRPSNKRTAHSVTHVNDTSQRLIDASRSLDAGDAKEDDESADESSSQPEDTPSGVRPPCDIIRESVKGKDKDAASTTSPPLGARANLASAVVGEKIPEDSILFCSDTICSLGKPPGIDTLEIRSVLTPTEIDMLFHQFMSKVNPYMSMFDERLHTIQYVKEHSPFLLSVITMISSRYYTNRPDAYVRLVDITKRLAGEAITNMAKSIMHIQAFILLASYPAPDRRYLNNNPWLYSGVAFRMATEMELYKPQPLQAVTEAQEREALNRTRTWIVCFYLDESISVHFGRPVTIARDDAVIKNATNWWLANRDRYSHVHDAHLIVFVNLLRAFRTSLEKLENEQNGDYARICREFDEEVAGLVEAGNSFFTDYTDRTDAVCFLRERMGDFTTQYSRLIIHSIAFQKGSHQTPELEQACLFMCLQSAFRVLEILTKDIVPTGLLRYACDGYFWYASFASAFLLKFLGAEYRHMVNDQTREHIVIRVRELIDALGSPIVTVDGSHPPRLFSRFLDGMLTRQIRGFKVVTSPAGGLNSNTLSHAHSVDVGGSIIPDLSSLDDYTSSRISSELGNTPEISLITATDPAPSFVHTTHQPLQTPLVNPSPSFYNVEHSQDLWLLEYDELMRGIGHQEMVTGMLILDHQPWLTGLNLQLEMAVRPDLGEDLFGLNARDQGERADFDGSRYEGMY